MKELLRIYNVLALFEKQEYCSKEEILEAASKSEEEVISYETWNRLRKKMFLDFGFEVIYEKSRDASHLSINGKVNRDRLMKLINHFRTMNLLQTYVEEDKEMIDRLEFEEGMSTGDPEHLDRLQDAMVKTESVVITHQGYTKEVPYKIRVNPLYFKQYQNRWYLIGEDADKKEFRSYGMDRIKAVEYVGKKFKSRINEAKKAYSQVVGVNLGDKEHKLQDIVILFEPDQKPYLESLKLHSSQTVLEDTEHRYKIKITVKPNYELQQQIQKYGGLAEVVEGEWECY